MESAISTMEKMIADAVNTIDPMDDVYLTNAIIQANKNARFPGYGMAVTLELLKKRDAEVAKQARAECAKKAVRWYEELLKQTKDWPKFGLPSSEALYLAIMQSAQGQDDPRECAQRFDPCARGEFVGLDEAEKIITARDAAIRAETAKDAMRWFDNYRKERGQSGNEAALHESLCAAICRKEVVG